MSQQSTILNDSKQNTKELTINDGIHMTKVSSSVNDYETSSDNNTNQEKETDFNQIHLPEYERIKAVGQGKSKQKSLQFFFKQTTETRFIWCCCIVSPQK